MNIIAWYFGLFTNIYRKFSPFQSAFSHILKAPLSFSTYKNFYSNVEKIRSSFTVFTLKQSTSPSFYLPSDAI